jgi:hypothetical protein
MSQQLYLPYDEFTIRRGFRPLCRGVLEKPLSGEAFNFIKVDSFYSSTLMLWSAYRFTEHELLEAVPLRHNKLLVGNDALA